MKAKTTSAAAIQVLDAKEGLASLNKDWLCQYENKGCKDLGAVPIQTLDVNE